MNVKVNLENDRVQLHQDCPATDSPGIAVPEAVNSAGGNAVVLALPLTGPSGILELPGFMRLKAVLEIVPVGRSKWYQGMKAGIYPRPVPLGVGRRRAYRRSDIKALIQQLDGGQGLPESVADARKARNKNESIVRKEVRHG